MPLEIIPTARIFGEYAMGQIRKARGLNKKIVNPQPETRSPLLAFCHVPTDARCWGVMNTQPILLAISPTTNDQPIASTP